MVTRSSLIYSAAALRRMWSLFYRRLTELHVREWRWVVWVWVPGYRPTFVPKAEFKHHFVEWRREAAQALRVVAWLEFAGYYTVHNDAKGSAYVVEVSDQAVACTCDDYKNQVKFLGKGCCKHGYAVLGQLGFDSLGEYLNRTHQRLRLLERYQHQPMPIAA